MLKALIVTFFPVAFLAVLFTGGELLRRRRIDVDGDPPINKALFYGSKYLILALWTAMVLDAWGKNLSLFAVPPLLKTAAVFVWAAGFALLFIGRFGLGKSFRIGQPRESTTLKVDGLFRLSRNPMYLGVYSTLLASVLHTLNPVLLVVAVFIAVVHHRIVLAEETYLRNAFAREYEDYCSRVRRYL